LNIALSLRDFRKRAKTEDEKEQRRIERVLRNRAAAQSSRERKRQEVEKLEGQKMGVEQQNEFLQMRLEQVEAEKEKLAEQVKQLAAQMAVFRNSATPANSSPRARSYAASPTLSGDLLDGSHESVPNLKHEVHEINFALPHPQYTLDPRRASFSSSSSMDNMEFPTSSAPSLTQHPAEMLCDLQCQLGAPLPLETPSMTEDDHQRHVAFRFLLTSMLHLLLATMLSTASSMVLTPLSQIFVSLKTGRPLPLSTEDNSMTRLFPLVTWLISTPITPLMDSTSLDRLTSPPTFRIRMLRRLLICSPPLARPLRDATSRALQLMSSDEQTRTGGAVSGDEGMSTLMTMLFTIESTEKSKDKTSPVHRKDPAGDIRKLCTTLDGLLGEDGREAKVFEREVGGLKGRSRSDRASLLSGKYL